MPLTTPVTFDAHATNQADAERKAKALATLSVLPADCLEILASKANRPGVAVKIKMFQHLI